MNQQINPLLLGLGAIDLSDQIREAKEEIQQTNPDEFRALTGGERLLHVDPKIQQREENRNLITGEILNAQQQRERNAAFLRTTYNTDPTTGLPSPPTSAI